MSSALYLVAGLAILLAAVLPSILSRLAISPPMVLLAAGVGLGLIPVGSDTAFDPSSTTVVEQVTQFAVLLALMGVGLALDRPLRLRHPRDWLRWAATWRLLLAAMPVSIAGVWLLGWWGLGLAPATALLLGAVLAPTDPVLAGDVQVGGPDVETQDVEESDERHEVRFALTSEAGLNDGLAFPFVYAAIYLAAKGTPWSWVPQWVAWDLVGKVVLGSSSARWSGGCWRSWRSVPGGTRFGSPSRVSRCWPSQRWRSRSARPSWSAAMASSRSSAVGWRSAAPSGATTTRRRCTESSSGSSACSPCSCCSASASR